jgi:RNA polymerase sigma-70 factor (ECF subfamily)
MLSTNQMNISSTGRMAVGADCHAAVMAALPLLRPMARRWSACEADGDDLVQETLERAIKRWDRFDGSHLVAWLRRIMHNVAVDNSRAAERERSNCAKLEDTLFVEDDDDLPEWSALSARDVERALDQLREPMRTTFRLFSIEGLSYTEISRRLGVPIGTIGTRILRARTCLREALVAQIDRARHTPDIQPAALRRGPAAAPAPAYDMDAAYETETPSPAWLAA